MSKVHATAAAGFDAAAEVYARARPGYPDAAVDLVAAVLPAGPVADVAAGTGILTRPLAARGIEVIGVEPVEGMRRAFAAATPGVPCIGATAESLPFARASLAGVTVAQAFHWFDPHAAVASLARCIRPGGALAVVWNVRDETVAWMRELTKIIDPFETDGKHVPRYRDRSWRVGFTAEGPFVADGVRDFANLQVMDVAGLRERVASVSFIAVLPDDVRASVLDSVTSLAQHPDLAGQERFAFPYLTEVHLFLRRDG